MLGWALAFGLVVDLWADGPPGLGVVVAVTVAAVGLVVATGPSHPSIAFLAAALLLTSIAVVRASPILIACDLLAAAGLFALAGAFAPEGEPFRAGL